MLSFCLDLLFGCLHRRQSRPFTLQKRCYTVCLNCGRELPYSWTEMRTLRASESADPRHPTCDEVRVAA